MPLALAVEATAGETNMHTCYTTSFKGFTQECKSPLHSSKWWQMGSASQRQARRAVAVVRSRHLVVHVETRVLYIVSLELCVWASHEPCVCRCRAASEWIRPISQMRARSCCRRVTGNPTRFEPNASSATHARSRASSPPGRHPSYILFTRVAGEDKYHRRISPESTATQTSQVNRLTYMYIYIYLFYTPYMYIYIY